MNVNTGKKAMQIGIEPQHIQFSEPRAPIIYIARRQQERQRIQTNFGLYASSSLFEQSLPHFIFLCIQSNLWTILFQSLYFYLLLELWVVLHYKEPYQAFMEMVPVLHRFMTQAVFSMFWTWVCVNFLNTFF